MNVSAGVMDKLYGCLGPVQKKFSAAIFIQT